MRRRKILHNTYVQYAILYTYGSTTNFFVLEPTALIYNYIKITVLGQGSTWCWIKIERVIRKYGDFSEGQLNANGL